MVLVVADNDLDRLGRTTQLLNASFPGSTVLSFPDPMLSVKRALEPDVDAVFAETRMRPVDGFELLHVLRINRPRLPVFLISEDEMPREAALRKGANEYLVRPLDMEELSRLFQPE